MPLTITPAQLPEALVLAPSEVQVLSLDCFDTLIWRNTHRPRDVFADLAASGCNAHQRIAAEHTARCQAEANGRYEVTIREIYRALSPAASDAAITASIAAELAAEARHCFAFAPTVELMRRAKARGLKLIIVSDTYLDRTLLRQLIGEAAGLDVLALIDEVFCSSEYGAPKAGGLFRHVLKALRIPAGHIFHLGDNLAADYTAPLALGLSAVHLQQFDADTEQRLRLEAAAAVLVSGSATGDVAVLQPHRADLMLSGHAPEDAAAALGHGTLGPILSAYAGWLRREVDTLAARTPGRVHLLFLMRDGHLPKLAYERPGEQTHAVEISRFTAIASSLADEAAILRYLEPRLTEQDPEVLGRQLLLTPAEVKELAGTGAVRARRTQFAREVRRQRVLRKIAARSQAFGERLVDYIRRKVDPAPGDVLVLADLGYNGTVQNHVEPLFRRAFGVEVAGRYLLLHQDDVSGCDKRGLIDQRSYGASTLGTLCRFISVLEQLCTSAQGSVIEYAGGDPVRKDSGIKGRQSAIRDQVQAACLLYVAQAGAGFHTRPRSLDAEAERACAAAALARLMFFPMQAELELLLSFEHDINLGTDQTLDLFDAAAATQGLKHWGLFYMNAARRMFLAAELRDQGLPLSLTLLTQGRFGLDLRLKDFSHRSLRLPIMVAEGYDVSLSEADAWPTHDGFFVTIIPVGACRFSIGVQFGKLYEWVQLEAAHFLPAADIPTKGGLDLPRTTPATPVYEGVEVMTGGMLRCGSDAGFMLVPPPPRVDDRPMVLAVVFRPLADRVAQAAESPARLQAAE
jgi:FMN phosphatase YigB (HAD superfamily)